MNSSRSQFPQSFEIPANELNICKDQVLRAMGYDPTTGINIPGLLRETLDRLTGEIRDHISIKAGFRIFATEEVRIDKTLIHLQDKRFQSGRIINSQLKKAETIALFVCSLGEEFDHWVRLLKKADDMLITYSADVLGSELVELAVDWLETRIALEAGQNGYSHSNRYSPGYCGWPLMDQHTLFSFLPENYCGIKLSKSALMAPIKSVSGLYGLGRSMRKRAYQCSICAATDCYKRIHQTA
ncbi:MAG: vitamin B12 dependent-methionine synthase activation domain-containing protein [Candidatus Marinimicrobia bacterium]|nr:vitamin B12 dependent-methionine synthase activation domain-containing protein [Candidatus Neomarinimicrobiota bacterium]